MSFKCGDCPTTIPGTNCAHALSKAEGWRKKPGCYYHCECGYPVRAKEVRDHIFKGYIDDDKKAAANAYIYCESNGGGHVYYGTFNSCVRGNGLAASGLQNCTVFHRYGSAS